MPNSLLRPINLLSRRVQIVERIRTLIEKGHWKVGEMIPQERALCVKFGVSRTVIREALQTLQGMGYLKVQHGKGTTVCAPSWETVRDALLTHISPTREHLTQLIDARRVLEVHLSALAAKHRKADDLKALEEALREYTLQGKSHDRHVAADLKFHLAIARAAHNCIFSIMLNCISSLLQHNFHVTRRHMSEEEFGKSISVHQRILEAIRAKNSDRARLYMMLHMDDTERHQQRALASGSRA